jgi:putative cardiolipin synthase
MKISSIPGRIVTVLFIFSLSACASLPPIGDRPETLVLRDTDETVLGLVATRHGIAHPGQSGFHLLSSGLDAFVARAVLANAAERGIDAQYYLFHNDLVGRLFIDLLLKAANRGVRVRLLVDDMAITGGDRGVAALDAHPNLEVRIFNPFGRNVSRVSQFLTRFGSVTRRMHNKSFTVDNQVTIFGGRNIGNEYFEADPDLEFADLDVMAVGPVVDEISIAFDKYWNSSLSYPIKLLVEDRPSDDEIATKKQALEDFVAQQENSAYLQALHNSNLANLMRSQTFVFEWGTAEVIYDDPAKVTASRDQTDLHLSTQLKPHIDSITEELIIFSPYFVPGVEGAANLRALAESGVRVRILTNSLASTDVIAVHAGYSRYRKTLLQGGVEIYEIDHALTRKQRKGKKGLSGSSKSSLHTKSFVLDRKSVFIGSLNLDPRSVIENTEIGAVIESEDIAAGMAKWFDQEIERIAFRLELVSKRDGSQSIVWHHTENGEAKIYTTEPYTSFWRRFSVGFLRLLPIESQL